jgi:hypothetical protein
MLKSFYKTLDEIPEGDRQHYKKIGDRYVLELDGEHPVQEQVKTVLQEKKNAETAKATAEAKVATLESQPTLPSGHVAVTAEEAKLAEALKDQGTPDEIKAKLTEHSGLKKTEALRQVASDSGYKLAVFQTLDTQAGGLSYENRDVTVDGKAGKAWHVKENNKWVPLTEFADNHWKDFMPSLTASEQKGTGTKVPGQGPDDRSKPNLYSQIRDEAKKREEANKTESTPLNQRKGITVMGAQV